MDEGRDELAAVLGIPHAVAYAIDDERRDLADAPEAVRAASQAFVGKLDHYDFDLGGALLDGRPLRAVDGGDVAFTFGDGGDNSERARGALREIIASRDVNGLTALTVCRQLMLVIGQLARRRAALDRA